MIDVSSKYLRVNGTFNHHRCTNSLQSHCRDDGEVAPPFERRNYLSTLPHRSPCAGTCHCRINSEFINEDQIIYLQRCLCFFDVSSLFRIGFSGEFGLFFKDRPSPCRPRQTVLILSSIRAFLFNSSLSSLRVASGLVTTSSTNVCR